MTAGSSVRGRHLPALDGLRALAVGAVVCYHLGDRWARGGYLGVDLFFVLSGFLITSLLLEERAERGRIDLAAFWLRRARRLLPALFVMVAVVVAGVAVEVHEGNPLNLDLVGVRDLGFATLGYAANWWQIVAQHSYFAQFSAPNPLQHTWSLAIEEQFYLAWPFVTLALVAGGLAARRRAGVAVTLVLAAGSTALMALLYTPGADPSRLYYGTDTRLADLAVGATLAWLTARRPVTPPWAARLLVVAGPASLGVVLWLMATAGTQGGVPSGFMFEGGFLGASVACALVIADVRRETSVLRRVFALRPLVAVGLVSYGVYLWHWPVIVLVDPTSVGVTGWQLAAVRLAILAALVVASYVLVEQPVRRRRLAVRLRQVLYPSALAATLAVVAVATPSIVLAGTGDLAATLLAYAPGRTIPGAGGVVGAPIALPSAPTARSPLRVALIGDSTLVVDGPGIAAALQSTGEVVVAQKGFVGWGTTTDPTWRRWVTSVVRGSRAELVLVTTGWDGRAALESRAYEQTLLELVRVARAAGAAGVVFLQYPLTRPLDASPAGVAVAQREEAAWNADAAAIPRLDPGRAMYFPLAQSVELGGAFSYWLPPPRHPGAPASTWARVRRLDGVHLCPAGVELFAAALASDVVATWNLHAVAPGWWTDGWQHSWVITNGQPFCPADHPPR